MKFFLIVFHPKEVQLYNSNLYYLSQHVQMISQNFLAMADKTEKVFRTRKFVLHLNFLEIVQPFKEWLILLILLQQFYFYFFNKSSLRISLSILRVKVQWMGFANSINPKTFICHKDHRIFIQQSIPIICTLPQINSF